MAEIDVDGIDACFRASGEIGFPCNADPIIVVILSIGAGVLSLFMVFYLMRKVSYISCQLIWFCLESVEREWASPG
jgi:hypothetical protein